MGEISTEAVGSQGFLSEEFALWNRYVMQTLLGTALLATGFHKHLAEKVLACHKKFRFKKCENNHRWAAPAKAHNSCSVRLCPHCSHRKVKKQGTRIQAFCVSRSGLRYLVLSERNSKNLAAGIKSLYEAWTSLRRSTRWKGKVDGCVAVLEVTYNKQKRTWHPHLNVLFEGKYFPQEELKQAWIKATNGRGRSVFIQTYREGTAFELIKYTLKVAELKDSPIGAVYQLLIDDPAALDEFLSAVYGCRLIRTYGTFRSMPVEEEEEEEEETCPDCGSTCIVDLGPTPPYEQLFFDFEKGVHRLPDKPRWFVGPTYDEYVPNPLSIAMAVEGRRRARSYEDAVRQRFVPGWEERNAA